MSVIYVVVQRLGNTLRLPLADLNNLDVPVGSYRIDGIEKVIVNPFKDATVFLPADRNLTAENAMLRGQIDDLHGQAPTSWHYGKLVSENMLLEDENAKLRKLARLTSEFLSYDRCEGCVTKTACNNGDVDECWMVAEMKSTMRELGIEVVS